MIECQRKLSVFRVFEDVESFYNETLKKVNLRCLDLKRTCVYVKSAVSTAAAGPADSGSLLLSKK